MDPFIGVKATAPKVKNIRSTTEVIIEIDDTEVDRMFERAIEATSDASIGRWMMGPLQQWMEEETVQRFAHEGDWRSEHWSELHDPTQAIRHTEGYDPNFPINRRTGELMDFALSYDVQLKADGMTYQTPNPGKGDAITQKKFLTAQEGDPGNPLPEFGPTEPRPVLAFSEEADTQTVLEMLTVDIARQIAGGAL